MNRATKRYLFIFSLILSLALPVPLAANEDPLPSWNDGPSKQAIVAFVAAVTEKGGKNYVPSAERIAVFDNDGTLWSEKPAYFQLLFAIDRIKALAPQHPEWKTQQPFKAVIEKEYGIPPEQVVGSSIKTEFKMCDDQPVLVRLPEIDFINDKAGKPVGINKFIGRRPIAAFGNSDGDLQMLQWTTAGKGKRFGLIVHHTDAEREWAYDRESNIGRLDKALEESGEKGWTIVDMKKDWKVIYPFEKSKP